MSAALQHAPGLNGTAPTPPVLQIAGLSKTFGATRALIDASLDIKPGEIHALVGQNGSGKSTLIKTLAGYHTPDSGSVAELDGAPFDLGHTVPDGLRFVHQDLGLVLELNAMDNLALHGGFARGALGRVHWSEQEQETRRVLARFGVDLDIHRPLAAATPVERTVVAIAAALQGWQGGHGVLVLDEPTAVLPHDEVERLFAMVREVRSAGTSVLYVSHRLDEIFELADRVTVLRGGRVIATHSVADIDAAGLASLMVGEDVDPDYRAPVAARPDAPVVLEARDIHGRWLRGVDLDVHRGEILGIAGLAGAGVLELPYALAGCARHAVSGRIRLPERSAEWSDVADAQDLDIPLVPADRGREGIVAEFAVSENLSLSVLGRLGRRGRLDKRAEAELVERWTRAPRRRDRRPGRADLDAQRRQPAEGRGGSLPRARPRAARPLRADRGRRHRDARGHLRPDRRAVAQRPDRRPVLLGCRRRARHVHARRRPEGGPDRRPAGRRGTY